MIPETAISDILPVQLIRIITLRNYQVPHNCDVLYWIWLECVFALRAQVDYLGQVEASSEFYISARIVRSELKCHMDAKSPMKSKKYKLIVYHQDEMLCHGKEDLPMRWKIPRAKVPLSFLLQANGWTSSHHFLQCGMSSDRKQPFSYFWLTVFILFVVRETTLKFCT